MSVHPLWIGEADVQTLLSLRDAIAALEHGLELEARGEGINLPKTHVAWQGGQLHALGAVFPKLDFAGTKTWAHTPAGATPLLILFDSRDGSLKAIIEAFTLGQLRTGGISAVATRWLAAESADELAIIGTGKQALMQVAAVAAVRPLRQVRVHSPNGERRAAFADRVRRELSLQTINAKSVAEAVADAAIITLVTRAKEPFLDAAMIARGAHVNAVGAITPERAEFAGDVLDRCTCIAADSVSAVQTLSREFAARFTTTGWERVTPLCQVVAGKHSRPAHADLTLFKAMGMGISDVALGIEVYRRAMQRGLGREVPRS